MKFTFGVDHTKHGCTVWMNSPSGTQTKARFRNGHCSALTSAEAWVWEQRQAIKAEAEIGGKEVEFVVPHELDRVNDTRRITLPAEHWAAIEAQAKSEGIGLSMWIGKAAQAILSQR
jgi:hypothetical protein